MKTNLKMLVMLLFISTAALANKPSDFFANQILLEREKDARPKKIVVSFYVGCVNLAVTIYSNSQGNFVGCLPVSICGAGCLGTACIETTVCVSNARTITMGQLIFPNQTWEDFFIQNNGSEAIRSQIEAHIDDTPSE